ncbi:MAG: hypothetical protein J6Z33_02940 [Lachnospiraceae bacterium]|nr:hypothetical protein [Lachnospiraceae bacterium]
MEGLIELGIDLVVCAIEIVVDGIYYLRHGKLYEDQLDERRKMRRAKRQARRRKGHE